VLKLTIKIMNEEKNRTLQERRDYNAAARESRVTIPECQLLRGALNISHFIGTDVPKPKIMGSI